MVRGKNALDSENTSRDGNMRHLMASRLSHTQGNRSNDYRNVARVTGKIGKSGEVKVMSLDGLPFLLSEGVEVHLTPPPLDGIRTAVVESCREIGDGWAVKFSGCDTAADAFDLKGRLCLVSAEDLPEIDEEPDPADLVGLPVVDEELGDLGRIADVLTTSEQMILVVTDREGAHEIMIPAVDEFVRSFDEEGTIFVSIPESLLHLND